MHVHPLAVNSGRGFAIVATVAADPAGQRIFALVAAAGRPVVGDHGLRKKVAIRCVLDDIRELDTHQAFAAS